MESYKCLIKTREGKKVEEEKETKKRGNKYRTVTNMVNVNPTPPIIIFKVNGLNSLIKRDWASLVAQWLRICLLMQGTRVRALVWEDPTYRRATRPVSHNYWACVSGACALQQERLRQWEAHAPRWRVAPACRN